MIDVFALINDFTFRMVAVGAGILGIVSGMIGSFAVMRRRGLMGDGISHATLPGIVGVFLLFNVKTVPLLLMGALVAGVLAARLILLITDNSKLKLDAALAIVMSVFFGLGTVLLTHAQKLENANQAGLDSFIFGQASALIMEDIVLISVSGIVLISVSLLFFKEIKLICFDRGFAQSVGISPRIMDVLLDMMTVACIIIGLQTVGVILMSALLIAPAVAARQWSEKFGKLTTLSCIFGAFSGVLGAVLSALIPKLPTGPAIVVIVSILVIISLLFAPKRGIISKLLLRRGLKKKVNI